MKPTDVLMHEHRVIELVLACLDRLAANCEAGHPLDVEAATQAIDFFSVFADQYHHAKEEDLLFPVMEAKGFSRRQGPTGVMLHEHELGRRHVRAMADAIKEFSLGDLAGKIVFVEHAQAYSALLRAHIQKEDHCLFPMAEQALSATDQQSLERSFENVDREHLGPNTHERYLKIAAALADRLSIPTTSASQAACGSCASSPSPPRMACDSSPWPPTGTYRSS